MGSWNVLEVWEKLVVSKRVGVENRDLWTA